MRCEDAEKRLGKDRNNKEEQKQGIALKKQIWKSLTINYKRTL